MQNKRHFISASVFSAISLLALGVSMALYLHTVHGPHEGFEGFGAAIIFALSLITGAITLTVCSVISLCCLRPAIRNNVGKPRVASISLTVFNVVTLLCGVAVLILWIVGEK